MPMAFASLLGGIVTLVGTSPNIIIAKVRAEVVGQPFGMFDYTPVGLTIAVLGVAFLSFGYRLLPRGRKAAASMDAAFNLEDYTAEAHLPDDLPLVGADRVGAGGAGRRRRDGRHDHPRALPALYPTPGWVLRAGRRRPARGASPRGWSAWSRGRASGSPTRSGPPTGAPPCRSPSWRAW